MRTKLWFVPVFLFALVHAALYCFLLPLWEGFDEPFHYAYLQSLAAHRQLPVLGQTTISQEVRTSLDDVPISFILKRNIPGTFSFEDWFGLSQPERLHRREQLSRIPATERLASSALLNYEAQQAPLSYLLLGTADVLLQDMPLPSRVLVLRLLAAFIATILCFLAFQWLCQTLDLQGWFRFAALAVFFGTQIYEASVAHLANDWLSITAAIWFFACLAAFVRWQRRASAFFLSVIVAIGLLAKAYFLAFVPLYGLAIGGALLRKRITATTALVSFVLTAVIAGPWYVRNLLTYQTLAGMQENVKGVNRMDALYAFQHIHWGRALLESARWGLWTGNESHLSFSQGTLNLFLLFVLAGLLLLGIRSWHMKAAEWWVLGGVLIFVLALVYDLCVTWADTRGMQNTTGPYYTPCVLPAVFVLAFLGCQRSGSVGRVVALLLSLLSIWIGLLTYCAKLFPYYGGFVGKATVPVIWWWWATAQGREVLAITILGKPWATYLLLVLYLVLLLWVGWRIFLGARTISD